MMTSRRLPWTSDPHFIIFTFIIPAVLLLSLLLDCLHRLFRKLAAAPAPSVPTIIVLLFLFCQSPPVSSVAPAPKFHSPYTIWNYTWQIINEAGDVVNSTSILSSSIPFPTLQTDLCILALGADSYWGTPDSFWPQHGPLKNPEGSCAGPCNDPSFWGPTGGREGLNRYDLYICPGNTHCSRTSAYTCGTRSKYFCAKWGCETSGHAYWNPSSSWDFITVRKGTPAPKTTTECDFWDSSKRPSNCSCCSDSPNSWCNPLLISFTNAGKNMTGPNLVNGAFSYISPITPDFYFP